MSSQTTLTVVESTPVPTLNLKVSKNCNELIRLFKTPSHVEWLLNNFLPGITTVCESEHDFGVLIGAFSTKPSLLKTFVEKVNVDFLTRTGPDDVNALDICAYYADSFDILLKNDIFTPEIVCRSNKDGKTIIKIICDPSTLNVEERCKSLEKLLESDKCSQDFVLSHREFLNTVDLRFQNIVKKSPKYVEPLTPEQIENKRLAEEKQREILLINEKIAELKAQQAELLKKQAENAK